MSKMSMIHAELMEQCARLGFQDLGEAEQAGYGVDWENGKLIKVEDEQDKAHEAWVVEQRSVMRELDDLRLSMLGDFGELRCPKLVAAARLERAINFIKEQCHD